MVVSSDFANCRKLFYNACNSLADVYKEINKVLGEASYESDWECNVLREYRETIGNMLKVTWERQKGGAILDTSKTAYRTKEEQAAVKDDLLHFIHAVAYGELSEPEHIKALVPAVEAFSNIFQPS